MARPMRDWASEGDRVKVRFRTEGRSPRRQVPMHMHTAATRERGAPARGATGNARWAIENAAAQGR